MRLPTRVVITLLLSTGSNVAAADPTPPKLTVTANGITKVLPFGRIVVADDDNITRLILTEQRHTCREKLFSAGPQVIVNYKADKPETFSILLGNGSPQYQGTVVLGVTKEKPIGTAQVDIPIVNGIGGTGTVDVEWCLDPVFTVDRADIKDAATTPFTVEYQGVKTKLAFGRVEMTERGAILLLTGAEVACGVPMPGGTNVLVFLDDKLAKPGRTLNYNVPDAGLLSKNYAIELVVANDRSRLSGRIHAPLTPGQNEGSGSGTFDVAICPRPKT